MQLELEAVAHAYGRGPLALNNLSLEFGPGVTGLVGANGAGKSTLMRVAAGALPPRHGSVRVGGSDLYGPGDRQDALGRIAWMPQNASGPRNVRTIDFVSYLTWMRGFGLREARERSREALADVRLESVAHERLGKLSGGMVRRVWLAQALAARPSVLLLDEPSTGLDPRQRATMVNLLAQRGAETVILSSHLLEDVVDLADRVVVLDHGVVAYDGAPPDGADRNRLLDHIPEGSEAAR